MKIRIYKNYDEEVHGFSNEIKNPRTTISSLDKSKDEIDIKAYDVFKIQQLLQKQFKFKFKVDFIFEGSRGYIDIDKTSNRLDLDELDVLKIIKVEK